MSAPLIKEKTENDIFITGFPRVARRISGTRQCWNSGYIILSCFRYHTSREMA